MKPSTHSSGSSVNQGQVGLFWFYKHRLMASPIPLDQAEARGAKRDSPEAHIAVWPRMVARYKAEWPILSILDYDEVPRGRVIFDTATQTFIIYMDATLFADAAPERKPRVAVRDALSAAFQLHGQRICFATDSHYCIDIWEEYDQAGFPHGR